MVAMLPPVFNPARSASSGRPLFRLFRTVIYHAGSRHVHISAKPSIKFDCSTELFENRLVPPIDELQVDRAARTADRFRPVRASVPSWQLMIARRGEEDAQ
jgi:hypothetical protein